MAAKPTDIFLDLPHLRSHIVDWGGPIDRPTILLIHGLASNAKMWNLVAPKLALNYRVVALDQRSHGLTEMPADNDFSFAAVCGDMHLVCNHIGISLPIVAGHSWGCSVALEYATRYADSVAGVVMIEGGFAGMNKVVTWPQFEKMVAPPRWAGTPLVEYLERAKHVWGKYYSAEVLDEIMGNVEVSSDQTVTPRLAYDNQVRIQRATWEQDADTLYAQVKSPALFLPCLPPEPHDPQTKQLTAWKKRMAIPHIQAAIPQAQIDWLDNSLHDVPLQRPNLIAEKIRAFAQAIVF
jgi:pimeloyl-ACP methyl ester carboxylesterase